MTPGFNHHSTMPHSRTIWVSGSNLRRPPLPGVASRSTLGGDASGTRCLDHRQDAGLDHLGQVGPCFDHGGQVGVGRDIGLTRAGSAPAVTPGAGKGRDQSGSDVMRGSDEPAMMKSLTQ